jgi:hypothetical protein
MPSIVLPSSVIRLIKEYSKPLSRPDWRTLRKMTDYKLYSIITNVIRKQVKLVLILQINMKDSLWYNLYSFTQCWGIEGTSSHYNMSEDELLKIDGIIEAIEINKNRMEQIRMKRLYGYI